MPLKVVCSDCGHTLHQSEDLSFWGFEAREWKPYYERIREKHDGKCPKCGHKLASFPVNVEVKGIERPDRAFFTRGSYVKRRK